MEKVRCLMKPLNFCVISRQHQLGQVLSITRTKKQGGHNGSLGFPKASFLPAQNWALVIHSFQIPMLLIRN